MKTNLIKYLCFILLLNCDYEQTILEYNTNTTELRIVSDTTDTYIRRFEIIFSDSLKLNYPLKPNNEKINKLNIADYFDIPYSKINDPYRIKFKIRSGVKSTGNAFDVCYDDFFLEGEDTVLKLKCLAR